MTTLETTQRDGLESIAISQDVGHAVVVAPSVARSLPIVIARLCERHPTVPVTIIERHVFAAAAQLTRNARIHDYLSILIERRATASLEPCCP